MHPLPTWLTALIAILVILAILYLAGIRIEIK